MDCLGVRCINWLYMQNYSTPNAEHFLLYFFDFTLQDYNVKIANLKLKQTETSLLLEYSRKIKIILHLANFVSLNKLDKV